MIIRRHKTRMTALLTAAALLAVTPAQAEMSAEELAKLAQNPVGNLISVPFQNNTNFNFGPEKGTQNVLNIQPVIPISIDSEWNIITRTILPMVSMPALGPGIDSTNGIGDMVVTAFLSPAVPKGLIWGLGPVVQIPTNSSAELGNKNWGLGPSFVVLRIEKGDPWVYGVLVNNIWSLIERQAGRCLQQRPDPALRQLQLRGRALPHFSAGRHRQLEGRQRPAMDRAVGRGVGKIFHFGKLPVNTQLSAYYNVVKPDFGPNWQLRAQVQFMFPK